MQEDLQNQQQNNEVIEQAKNCFKIIKSTRHLEPRDILGPGIRSRINMDFYWRRKTDMEIFETLKNGYSLLILGNSLAGKTRALYEALKKLDNTTVMVPHDSFDPEAVLKLPEKKSQRFIALFDDIDQFLFNYSKENLEKFLFQLMKEDIIIAATCRLGNEYLNFECIISYKIRLNFKQITINRMNNLQVNEFIKFIDTRVKKKKKREIILDKNAFDRNIGSYFMNLTVIWNRYKNLRKLIEKYDLDIPPNLPGTILKALKYFYHTENTEGKSTFSIEKIKDFCERHLLGKKPKSKLQPLKRQQTQQQWHQQLDQFLSQAKDKFTLSEWKNVLALLGGSEYELNFFEQDGPYIRIEEVYLERLIERNMNLPRIITILKETYKGEDIRKYGFLNNVYGYTRLINLARTTGEAFNILTRLNEWGIQPTVVTYTSLINKAANFKEALPFLNKMIEQGIEPDEICFTALINKVENFDDATSFLDKMIEQGLKPNVINFTSLINKTETFQQTYTILERMKTQQVRPNNFTISSLIKKVNQNPRQALETLFETYKETTIFSNYLFNRIITEACKAETSCKELILSHVPVISQQEDPIIFHYARTMEFIRATSVALELLEDIKNKNFDYYNIKANCLKENDFKQALELYQTALQFSKDKKQRTITLNNAAQLIVDHKQETLYSTAIDYCKEALSLRPFSQFPYPGHLLIELTILQSPTEEVEKNLSDIMSTYRIPKELSK